MTDFAAFMRSPTGDIPEDCMRIGKALRVLGETRCSWSTPAVKALMSRRVMIADVIHHIFGRGEIERLGLTQADCVGLGFAAIRFGLPRYAMSDIAAHGPLTIGSYVVPALRWSG